jgi:bifunctional DNase/RNase
MGIPVEVVGVRIELPSNQPILLLKECDGIRYLPIWVGAVEASAIAFAQQGVVPIRPLTHDLFTNVLGLLNAQILKVDLTDVVDGVFMAELHLAGGEVISARPSDGVALALRSGALIEASEELFTKVGIEIPDQGDESDDEVEKFREFLDHINPEDFAS